MVLAYGTAEDLVGALVVVVTVFVGMLGWLIVLVCGTSDNVVSYAVCVHCLRAIDYNTYVKYDLAEG